MKRLSWLVVLCMTASSLAFAGKPCEELKDEITKKLEASGVKVYTLEVVAKDKETDAKVVGTCGGGASKIVYTRGAAKAEKPAEKKAEKPAEKKSEKK